MILKNLLRRGVRSALTLLGIAIGVAAVVALGAMADGLSVNYATAVGGGANDLLITQADAMDPVFSNLDDTIGSRLQGVPGVDRVEPGIYTWVSTGDLPFFLIFGYDPGSVAADHYRIVEGKPVVGPGQIVIGQRAVEALKMGIGDSLRVYGVPYRIVGIYETGQGMEESGGVVTLEDAQEIAQLDRKVSLYQIGLRRGTDAEEVIQRIETLDLELNVSRTSEREGEQQWDEMLRGFAWGVSAIAILIGGLGMMNAMVMSVLERTREIGTLRAVGWSRWRVLRMILGESLLLSLAGGVTGIAIGVGLTEAASRIPGVGNDDGRRLQRGSLPRIGYRLLPRANRWGLSRLARRQFAACGGFALRRRRRRGYHWLDQPHRQPEFPQPVAATQPHAAGGHRIGIGVATLVMLGGLSNGLMGQLNSLAGSSGAGNLTVMQRDVPDMSLSSLDERVVSQIQAIPQVKSVSPMVMGFVMTADMPMFIIQGVEPNSAAISHYALTAGRHVRRPNEIVIGGAAAETYDWGIDDTVTLYNTRYKVVGIFETGVAWEENGGILAMRESQRLLNRPRTVSFIFVDVHDPADAEGVRDLINRRIDGARASMSSEFAQNTDDMANMAAMTGAISLLALIVGGIVVVNTMVMSIYERTREIGTLRALGWSSRRILSQIVQESVLLCLLSAILGTTFGVLMLNGVALIPGMGSMLAPKWSADVFGQAIGLMVILGLLGGLYPAWRAGQLRPVEALRYE
ncbi:MAG: FtsX-like permease family protein [Caldilineaceae bacterium]